MNIKSHYYGLIDLHLHLDGSLSVATVRELAEMQSIPVPESDDVLIKMLQVSDSCKDLNEYLEKFDFPCSLLQTEAAITLAVQNLRKELAEQGLLYAEIRFAPQLHTLQGLNQDQVVRAAIRGLQQGDFRANLILCCMRGNDNVKQNLETVRVASQYLGQGVCAIDLAGAEALFPTRDFEILFREAQNLGVPYTIHAGEADGPESVRTALKFGTKRIGHGVRSVEDPELVSILVREGITLELCPTSNLNTNIFDDIHLYPLPMLMEAGVRVTINTDNMMVSGVTLESELDKVQFAFSLTKEQIKLFAANAADACFASEEIKSWLRQQIDVRFA